MPKNTFHSLDDKKKDRFIRRALEEFTLRNYQEASISAMLKSLGIAKGSFYQYFDDKYDLFTYLIEHCTGIKRSYVSVGRSDFSSFWSYFRALYEKGLEFDRDHPLECHFLHRLQSNLNSPPVRKLYDQLLDQVVKGFDKMISAEVADGNFRSDLSKDAMAYFVYKNSVAIQEFMQYSGSIDIEAAIKAGRPVYYRKHRKIMTLVDEYIEMMRSALEIKN